MTYEVVVREKPRRTVYLRKAPDRSFDASSYWRKLNMLRFAKINYESYGMPFEERIEKVIREMKPVKPEIRKTVYLTPKEYAKIRVDLWRKGIFDPIEEVLNADVVVVREEVKKAAELIEKMREKRLMREVAIRES